MDKYTLESLNRLLDYVYDDESENYEETSDLPQRQRDNHIFIDIKILSDWYKNQYEKAN